MLAVLPGGVGWVAWDLQGEDPSLGSSLAEAAAAAGISLRAGWAGMSGTHPSPLALNRDNRGRAVIAWYCCCAPLMLVMVLNTSTTPLSVLWAVCLSLPILHPQHPSPRPPTAPSSRVRLLLAGKPCERHRVGAELGYSSICFGLGISQPSRKRAAATSCQGRGPASPRAAGAVRGHPGVGDGARGGAGLAPLVFPSLGCRLHALGCPGFYAGFGQGTRARARKSSRRILPRAAGEPGAAEVACLFKVQTSAVNLLPVCISLEPPGAGGAEMGSPLCAGAGSGYWKWR